VPGKAFIRANTRTGRIGTPALSATAPRPFGGWIVPSTERVPSGKSKTPWPSFSIFDPAQARDVVALPLDRAATLTMGRTDSRTRLEEALAPQK